MRPFLRSDPWGGRTDHRLPKMIYNRLASIYGASAAEEILLQATSLLGRLPHAYFVLRERETCPRISCPYTMVWFSYLENTALKDDDQTSELFTVQLLTDQRLSLIEFSSSCVEVIAAEVDRHERDMRAKQTQMLVDDQVGIDTGIIRTIKRLC